MATQLQARRLTPVAADEDQERRDGANFKDRRIALGLSVAGFARMAGVDRGILKQIEAGTGSHRDTTIAAIERTLSDLEEELGMGDPTKAEGVIRFVVRGVYGAEALVVEGPVENIAAMEASIDRIMRGLRDRDSDDT